MGERDKQRDVLEAFRKALRQEEHSLAVHDLSALPQLMWQQLSNRLRHEPLVAELITAEEQRLVEALDELDAGNPPLLWFRALTRQQHSDALVATLEIHDGEVWACRFSRDGKVLVSVGEDSSPCLAQVGSWAVMPRLDESELLLTNCAFSADGSRFAASSAAGRVVVWDWPSGHRLQVLEHHFVPVSDLAFSPDGRLLVTTAINGAVTLWDVRDGRRLSTQREHEGQANCCAYAPDGSVIVTGGDDGTLRLWDGRTANRLAWTHAHPAPVTRVRYAPDASLIASSGNDGAVRLFDPADGRPIGALQGHRMQVWSLAFSPDSRMLASCGTDHTVRLWDVASQRAVAVLRSHAAIVSDCDFSPDGRTLVSCDKGRTTRVWDLTRPLSIDDASKHESWVLYCRFSRNGQRVVSSDESGKVVLWSAEDARAISTVELSEAAVGCVDFTPDGRVVVASSDDGAVRIWDTHSPSPRIKVIITHKGNVGACAVARNDAWIISGAADRTLCILDVSSAKTRTLTPEGGLVYCVAISPDSREVAVGCGDGSVELRDIASGKPRARSRPSAFPVMCIEFLGDDRLACAFEDGRVRLLMSESLKPVLEIKAHRGRATGCASDMRASVLASSGEDRSVRLWDPLDGTLLGVICAEGDPRTCAVSPAGDRLAYGDTGSNLVIGELHRFPVRSASHIRGRYDSPGIGSREAGSGAVPWAELSDEERALYDAAAAYDSGDTGALERLVGQGLSADARLEQDLATRFEAAYESQDPAKTIAIAREVLTRLDESVALTAFARAVLHMFALRFGDASDEFARFFDMDTSAAWYGWAIRAAHAELEGMRGTVLPDLARSDHAVSTQHVRDKVDDGPCPCGSGKKYRRCCGVADDGSEARTCPSCSSPVSPNDLWCPSCGKDL